MEYSQLYKRYYSKPELSEILGVAKNVAQEKLRKIAKKQGAEIHIKTTARGTGVQVHYKLVPGEYQREYICDDEYAESVIEWEDLRWRCCRLGNTKFDLVTFMFNNRDRYLTYNEISEQSGISHRYNVTEYINQLEKIGIVFHKRNMKINREIKMVALGDRRGKTKYLEQVKAKPVRNLINKVFR